MIRRLPKDVVDRIAAGEVIERPASVVKELVENSLDAGAREIEVEIEDGGKSRLAVADDGSGMDVEDLRLAFVPHATSKLTDVDDLLSIASFGFRGEALGSVGAVSRARIQSRLRGGDAHEIQCEGGAIGEPRPCALACGTVVEAQNLFFNVPARARFLKGAAAEASRCLDAMVRLALAHEGVGFRLKSGGRLLFEVARGASRRERCAAAFGSRLTERLIEARGSVEGVHVEALLAPPGAAKGSSAEQYLFLNGRTIKDAALRAAVKQAFREFLAPQLQPVYALFLAIDPGEVDVNVHPAKTEVRFRDGARVFRAVHRVVLDALRGADLAERPAPPESAHGAGAAEAHSPLDRKRPYAAADRVLESAAPPLFRGAASGPGPAGAGAPSRAPLPAPPLQGAVPPRTGAGYFRAFSTYVLYESGGDLVLVDQHALHERILFERLRREVDASSVQRQRLLVPIAVEVGAAAVVEAEAAGESFLAVGLEVGPLSRTALAVHAVPAVLARARPEELVRAVLSGESRSAPLIERIEERLHTMACHAAVKAGDRLQDSEIEALLAEAEHLPEAKACPHGRPTCAKIAQRDLERWFHRA